MRAVRLDQMGISSVHKPSRCVWAASRGLFYQMLVACSTVHLERNATNIFNELPNTDRLATGHFNKNNFLVRTVLTAESHGAEYNMVSFYAVRLCVL